ncbi:unnamed protein product [Lepeophtheirus salmonis]|uniref:(salmon louse) hypothetical protein n=1 Tax=Lepeophtheirus salmonis TaxID=72036 RepID=A0A7R8HCW9_LEPSM|nr:unnamed protein product [Lepeophtheirus salmonis]CAF3019042.1 unnamed protein product [Lepeophtheirus salmonis]
MHICLAHALDAFKRFLTRDIKVNQRIVHSFFARLESLLNETSYGLYRLSQSKGYIGDFQIILPPTWDVTQCQPSRFSRIVASSQRSSSPDFFISPTNDLEEPRAEQFGSCGSMGYRIHVPKSFFDFALFQDSWELRDRGQTLLREWAKYRYGVFPENGFKGDPLYPHMYADGNEMKFSSGCSNAQPFCSLNQTYDKYAPTKQNLLCEGQRSSQIINHHKDFIKRSPNPVLLLNNETEILPVMINEDIITPKDPTFSYVVGKSSTFSILLDRTSIMGINNRWTNIKRAFYRFIQYIPVGTQLNIISFGSESVIDLPATIVTDSNREGLHGRIPRKVLEEEEYACASCALNVSFNSLRNYLGETEPGNVILVTGSPSKPNEVEDLLQVIEDAPVRVFPIIYPGTAHPDVLAFSVFGKQYSIPEGSSNPDPLSILSETLMDILKEAEGIQIQKVHETKHYRELEVSGTFTMEEDILHKMSVTLSIDDEERFEDGMVVFNHPGLAESGIWTYHAKLYPETNVMNHMSVDVVSQSNNAESEPFILEAFFLPLTKGLMKPVIKAFVTAKIYRPGDAEPIQLLMRDNGLGYPDISKNDGIYSVYFSEFASIPGYYSVQVSASHNEGLARTPKSIKITETVPEGPFNTLEIKSQESESCCGSIINYEETIPANPFHRQTVGNGFYVKQGLSDNSDVSPPSRVLDLKVEEYIEDSLYMKLKWTAPGGDYDKGKASKYEIRCYTSREALEGDSFSDKGILVHASFTPDPLSYGHEQSCKVGIPWPNEKFYYALVAFDESGNSSPISNVASAYIYEAPTTTTLQGDYELSGASVEGNLPFMESTGRDVYERSKQVRVYVITGTVVGLLILIIAIIGIILLRTRTKRAQYDGEEKDTYKTYEPADSKPGPINETTKTPNLNDWLDSLPRSTGSPDTTAHDLSVDGTLVKRNHTLSKTNPYRHKVLTNGSFLNLKESCDDASNSSSRPTTSTTDPDSTSEHSESSPHRRASHSHSTGGAPNSILKRSNTVVNTPIDTDTARAIIDTYTTGHLFNRSPNYFSFRENSTSMDHGNLDPPPGFSTDYPTRQMSHKKKRTESVV